MPIPQGFVTLLWKEVLRFLKVSFQTIAAPVLTVYLYLLIFSHVLDPHVGAYMNQVAYTAFLVPGLAMMAVLQNSFANSSSSLIQSKITGNIVFLLLSPLTHGEIFWAYTLACVLRGFIVGAFVVAAGWLMTPLTFAYPLWILAFLLLGGVIFGCLGIISGLWAERFDQIASFQNFIILPMTFLSGVFYSLHSLASIWQNISLFNPVFYLMDGFRHGFFAVSDISPWRSLMVCLIVAVALAWSSLLLLRRGYKLRR